MTTEVHLGNKKVATAPLGVMATFAGGTVAGVACQVSRPAC